MMELRELAKEVDRFVQANGGYWSTSWLLAAVIEELGELSRALQSFKGIRNEHEFAISNENSVSEECGDLFFALLCLTNSLGIDLEKALKQTLEKYSLR